MKIVNIFKEGKGICTARRLLVMPLAIVLCVALTGCRAESTFDGSRSSNDHCFQMDYLRLNRQESASLTLAEGDSLRVTVAQEAGTVDITVGIDGKEPIYKGNGLTEIAFVLHISEGGRYQIMVTGHHACGKISFTKDADSA